jgi:ketosteroid isomerase-like protein
MSLAAFSSPELERFTRTFEELFYADDPDSMTSYYTQDAQLVADGIAPIEGHAAIRKFWQAAIDRAAAAKARRTIQLHEASSSGDLGYALCTVTVEIPADGGAARDNTWQTGTGSERCDQSVGQVTKLLWPATAAVQPG